MKQWYWLILELLILFGTTTWIYLFPDEAEFNLAKGAFGFALIYFIETVRKETNEEKKLKVSDLKLGDIVRHKSGNLEYLVTGIDYDEEQVFFRDDWYDDEGLENWEKVEK